MKPFSFSGDSASVLAELARFALAAQKPPGYNLDAERRLACYLFQHRRYVVDFLKRQFPKSWEEIQPYVLPVTRFFVNERAKVFLDGAASLSLVGKDKKPLPAEDDALATWQRIQDDVSLGLALKQVDRYTQLFSTCFQKWGHNSRGVVSHVALPQLVEVVWDPDHPFNLDMAYAVRVEIGSVPQVTADGAIVTAPLPQGDGTSAVVPQMIRRWEFWCARPESPFYAIVRSDGSTEDVGAAASNPYEDDDGNPIVPVVMFTRHTEELGAFTLAGAGLADFDIAFGVELSNLQHIAYANGYGQLVISTKEGYEPPKEIERGPTRAIPLPEGNTATILAGNAPIADLVTKALQNLRLAALMHGIPPGSVSIEARSVASGVALQIELRPLLEERGDSIDVYRSPMRREWRVAKAVWNRYAREQREKEIPAEVDMLWRPGDVQMPTDPAQDLDDGLVQLANDLATAPEIIAKLRKLPLEEARALYERIRAENAVTKADLRVRSRSLGASGNAAAYAGEAGTEKDGEGGGQGVTAGAKAKLMPPGAQRAAAAAQDGGTGEGGAAAAE